MEYLLGLPRISLTLHLDIMQFDRDSLSSAFVQRHDESVDSHFDFGTKSAKHWNFRKASQHVACSIQGGRRLTAHEGRLWLSDSSIEDPGSRMAGKAAEPSKRGMQNRPT